MSLRRRIVDLERSVDTVLQRRRGTPQQFRIETYRGHGGPAGVVVRGRVLDGAPPTDAVDGEGVLPALRRTLGQFVTRELPGVPLLVRVAGAEVSVVTDPEGYFLARLQPDPRQLQSPWTTGTVELAAAHLGITDRHSVPVEVLVPSSEAAFGVISDVDDTVLVTGVQRALTMLRQTFTGSALTRTTFPGTAELYRDLAGRANPVFYVSSSPWNLHAFLDAFLAHRGFPRGPLLLRDLLGTRAGREPKAVRLAEVLGLHPQLRFVLLGDSGEEDPAIYADLVRAHPGRVIAVYVREVRLDPTDGRVERVTDGWDHDVPFVLAAETEVLRADAEARGLLSGSR